MTIERAGAESPRLELDRMSRDTERTDGEGDARPSSRRGERSDRVEISDAGRALAGESDVDDGGLSPERLAELRQRLENGWYDRPESAEALAKRLLDDGVV